MKIVVLLGPPGCGKGTQAEYIHQELKAEIISAGNLLRMQAKKDVHLRSLIESGNLVDSALITQLVCEKIEKQDNILFILDGFPRNLKQTNLLQEKFHIDLVLRFIISVDALVERLSQRLFHPGSGRTYHTIHRPPKKAGVDDITGELLVRRKDDEQKTIESRIQVYQEETEPLVDFYRRLKTPIVKILADQPIEKIQKICIEAIRSI